MSDIYLILVDPKPAHCSAFQMAFKDLPAYYSFCISQIYPSSNVGSTWLAFG